MLKKGDLKAVGIVAVGVILAGYIFNQFGDLPVVTDARDGYGY